MKKQNNLGSKIFSFLRKLKNKNNMNKNYYDKMFALKNLLESSIRFNTDITIAEKYLSLRS